MKLTDEERARWLAAATPAERRAIIRDVRWRERFERMEQQHEDAIVDSLRRFVDRSGR